MAILSYYIYLSLLFPNGGWWRKFSWFSHVDTKQGCDATLDCGDTTLAYQPSINSARAYPMDSFPKLKPESVNDG